MPNTLAHIGIQLPFAKTLFKDIEAPWILAGIILPDIPWILQRAIFALYQVNVYDLRLYVTIQASLFFCLILAAALACFSPHPLRIFFVLSLNCLIHLLLDGLQMKWGNGVHLFLPFSWSLFNIGTFWPEHIISYILTGIGFFVFCYFFRQSLRQRIQLVIPNRFLLVFSSCLFLLYMALPFALLENLTKSNSTSVSLLQNSSERAGKYIELDRVHYSHPQQMVTLLSGEKITIEGKRPKKTSQISLKGTFETHKIIRSSAYHIHSSFRVLASYIGLALSLILCTLTLYSTYLRPKS